jgi:transposase-like protein
MTKVQDKAKVVAIKELLERDEDFVRSTVQHFVQAALEAEMSDALCAGKGERAEGRLGYRSGYYQRALIARVGTLELRVPQDRAGRFSTELFERYQRSEKALVGTLAEMGACPRASEARPGGSRRFDEEGEGRDGGFMLP